MPGARRGRECARGSAILDGRHCPDRDEPCFSWPTRRAPTMTMTRRTVLRGVGGAVLALPFLEAMSTSMRAQRAHAAAVPSRLVVLYFPNGTYGDANGTALYPT